MKKAQEALDANGGVAPGVLPTKYEKVFYGAAQHAKEDWAEQEGVKGDWAEEMNS